MLCLWKYLLTLVIIIQSDLATDIPPPVKNIVGKTCVFQIKVTSYNTTHGCEEYIVTRVLEISTDDNNPKNNECDGNLGKRQKIA